MSEHQEIEELLFKGLMAKERKDFSQASALLTKVIIQSEEMNYPHGVVHGLLNCGLMWKIKAREKDSKAFASFARLNFQEALNYAKEKNMPQDDVMQAKFLLAQAEVELGNFSGAISLYQEVYDFYQHASGTKAHLGDVQRHLGTALVKSGKKDEGMALMQNGLAAIRTYDEKDASDKRNYVWEAGALLGLSQVYSDNDGEKARQLAKEALEIAEREDLVIRRDEANQILDKLR